MANLDEAHPLFLFAMDQRSSLLEHTYDESGGEPVDEAEAQRVRAGKQLVYRGVLSAIGAGAAREHTGVLVDERYGADVARLVKEAGLQLAMPVERSGREWFELEYGDDWTAHVDAFDPDFVKVLVRDNPAFDPERRAQQAADLAAVSRALHDAGRPFLVELLVPGTDEQQASVDDYDRDLRPDLVVQVLEYLQDHGVEADVWKLEGLDAREDAERVVATARRGGRDGVQCIVLGRDAPEEQLDHWLRTAAPVDGFVGFAIGRSNWEEPLEDVVREHLDTHAAEQLIAANYRHFVDTWLEARGDVEHGVDAGAV
ncbi:2-deoxy-5-keto-D-gluconate 6-phosphate aldolase domain-containing protein [Curtobacterium sp. L1-20]|jgi:myo-inositol catabolism protein IolC|uniref:2-deoxy-5-keto-D-gluconate 6-phosphate aldolase domain-containing protein n=1 Tax=Curtobacterium sp. L1-20 TaxID=3138181 RepID=UPI003B52CE27